jgi:hypothetical protein
MSKKLLEESTIRSFMKLANLQPLTNKFLKESEEQLQEDEGESDLEESAPPDSKTSADERDRMEEEQLEEEVVEEEADKVEEGKESEGRSASPKQAPKGTSLAGKKPGKMAAAKNAPGDAKLSPAKKTSHHSDKPDSIEFKQHSNAPKKNNSQFEVVSEALEQEEMEMEEEAPEMGGDEGGAEMGSAGESGEHQELMKGLIRDMLAKLAEMGGQYGLDVDIQDGAGGGEAPEAPEGEMAPPEGGEEDQEDESVMEQKLDEMVEKLTSRVAARLVKESKKKR